MLRFVIGTAGTGKTTFLLEKIKELSAAGKKLILLVPEQFSFESERAVYRALGAGGSLNVEVLSFTRLCNNIFRTFGGLAGIDLTKTAKYLFMSIAVGELGGKLKVYKKSAVNTAFLETALSACSEFKSAGVTPEKLAGFADGCGDNLLRDKLSDLAALYGAYQALIDKGYADSEDCLIKAASVLAENDYFSGFTVFVDGFTAFMAGEYAILRHAIAHSEDIWFAMTADSVYDNQQGMGLFSPVKATIRRLSETAKLSGTAIAKHNVLREPLRFKNDALRFLSKRFMEPAAPRFEGDTTSIGLYAAKDVFDEAAYVAASISALVEEGFCRYRDIAVVARETNVYLRPLELAFTRCGIPFFADDPEDIENMPLTGAVLSALDAVRSGFDSRAVMTLSKSPALGFDAQSVAELENYVYIWDIKGALWHGNFTNNPRGLAENLSAEDVARLARINETRIAVIGPLTELREAMRKGTGADFARGIFGFLTGVRAAENLTAYAKTMPQGERDAFLDENALLWDVLMGILDLFGGAFGSVKMPAQRLCDLFRLAAASADASTPPQTLDQVIVGKADRIRSGNVCAAFVMGANEGVFPPQAAQGGVFSDSERRLMIESGLEISPPSLSRVVLERYFAYFALTLPSEKLYVSYCRAGLQGNEMLPSVIAGQLNALFPNISDAVCDDLFYARNERTTLALLAERYKLRDSLTASLRAFFNGSGDLERLERAAFKPVHRIIEPSAAHALFGRELRLSPTRVERYYRCPFSYFAADSLGLRKRQKVAFTPIESGSVAHHVLHVMLQRHGGKGLETLSLKQLEDESRAIISAYITDRVESMDALPVRFKYLFERLCGMLARILRHMSEEFAQSKFEPEAFELPIRLGEETEPLTLKTAGGETVIVEGVVDRVDVMRTPSGAKYVRVVDYKSGGKDFKLQDVLYGLNMQMLLYLFTIRENGGGGLGGGLPAGVLYMPVREAFVNADRNTADGEIAAAKRKSWRMSGLLLEDAEALRGMEENIAGVFIPAKLKKDGTPDSHSSLISLSRMGKLSRKVMELTARIASSLSNGEIASKPVDSPDYEVCGFCDYRSICGFEEGDAVRKIARLDRESALRMLDREDEDNG